MTNKYYIYRHIRLDSRIPFYVGKGHNNRAYSGRNRNQYWHNIVKKCEYEVEIILDNLTEGQAFEKEIEFIKLYKSYGYCGANFTKGGEGISGYRWTDIQKLKLKNKPNGKYWKGKKLSCDMKDKISKSKKGQVPWMRGKTHSKQSILKMKESSIGNYHTTDTKSKLKKATQGENNPMYGKVHSELSIIKNMKSNGCKYFKVFTLNDIYIGIWLSKSKCANDLSISKNTILNCLKKNKPAKQLNLRFEYT